MKTRFVIYLLLLLVIFIIGVARYRKLATPFRLLTLLILFTLVSEIFSRVFVVQFRNSSPVYHFYIPVQFCMLISIYALLSKWKSSDWREWLMFSFIFFACINLFYWQPVLRFPSNTILVSCCILITASLFHFKRMLNEVETTNIFTQSAFWFNAAVLFFFTITFLYWGIYNFLLKNYISTRPISTIVYYVNILFYTMLGLAVILDNRKPSQDAASGQ